jgi:hypothetical protein
MFTIISSEFQKTYQRLTEPTVVTARWRTLGTWYPAGYEPDNLTDSETAALLKQRDDANRHAAACELAARGLEDEVTRLKRELAARPMAGIKAVVPKGSATSVYDGVPWKDRPATPAKK